MARPCAASWPVSCPRRTPLCSASTGSTASISTKLVALATEWGRRLEPHLADTTMLVQQALARGEHILFEGAQGTPPRP